MTMKVALTAYLIFLAVIGIITAAIKERHNDLPSIAGSMIGIVAKHVTILGGLWYCGFWA